MSFSSRPRRQRHLSRLSATGSRARSMAARGGWLKGGGSDGAPNHQLLDLADRPRGVQALGADIDAIHDAVAAEQPIRIFEVVEPLAGGLVAAVGDEAVGLQ